MALLHIVGIGCIDDWVYIGRDRFHLDIVGPRIGSKGTGSGVPGGEPGGSSSEMDTTAMCSLLATRMVGVGLLLWRAGSEGTNRPPPDPVDIALFQMLNVITALLDNATHTETVRAVTLLTMGPANTNGSSIMGKIECLLKVTTYTTRPNTLFVV